VVCLAVELDQGAAVGVGEIGSAHELVSSVPEHVLGLGHGDRRRSDQGPELVLQVALRDAITSDPFFDELPDRADPVPARFRHTGDELSHIHPGDQPFAEAGVEAGLHQPPRCRLPQIDDRPHGRGDLNAVEDDEVGRQENLRLVDGEGPPIEAAMSSRDDLDDLRHAGRQSPQERGGPMRGTSRAHARQDRRDHRPAPGALGAADAVDLGMDRLVQASRGSGLDRSSGKAAREGLGQGEDAPLLAGDIDQKPLPVAHDVTVS